MNENKNFKSANFYLSCFLIAKDLELLDIEKNNTRNRRSQFVFSDTAKLRKLVRNFNFSKNQNSEVLVDARVLISAIKTLKDKLYQES
ncbi:MAG TPA: DUF5659 domain-containing protein [Patescibacteria group bacterium]|nr:DUF5659 domain-containing protein [Patescibacteria group bacterium]